MRNEQDKVRDIVAAGNITADSSVSHIVETIRNYVDNPDSRGTELHLLVRVLVNQDRMKRDRMHDHLATHGGRPDLSCDRCIEVTRACGVDIVTLSRTLTRTRTVSQPECAS